MCDGGQSRDKIAQVLCGAESVESCPLKEGERCLKYGGCRIKEKTDRQIEYVLSDIAECAYLRACAGSGKTEVLGMKAAYEMLNWKDGRSGIAVLTFTNAATDTVKDRINGFFRGAMPSRHYVGTLSSFIHGFISQKFGYILQEGDKDDMSFTLVDSSENVYEKRWLDDYKVSLTVKSNFYANKLYRRPRDGEWFVKLRRRGYDVGLEPLRNLYNQNLNSGGFDKTKKTYGWLISEAEKCKNKFIKNGYATFEDMTDIAVECLKRESICNLIAKKFPVIMVDECQDLSFAELQVLKMLHAAGSAVHFIGDLNQAIYSFKDSDPSDLSRFIEENNINTYLLNENFRSTQTIVDVACRLQAIEAVEGKEKSRAAGRDAVYIEYGNINEAIDKFAEAAEKLGIGSSNRAVLVRTNALLNEIKGSSKKSFTEHYIITSVMLWKRQSPEDMRQALVLLGKQLRRWIKYHVKADVYGCPKSFNGSALEWRLKLKDILNEVCAEKDVADFDDKTYSQWYRSSKAKISEIVCKILNGRLTLDQTKLKNAIRTPQNSGELKIAEIDMPKDSKTAVKTIHSAKGESYDAVLFLSDKRKPGKNKDCFTSWLGDDGEERRCAYVAVTRPRYFLCLGVPTLKDDQRKKIEELGFVKYSD